MKRFLCVMLCVLLVCALAAPAAATAGMPRRTIIRAMDITVNRKSDAQLLIGESAGHELVDGWEISHTTTQSGDGELTPIFGQDSETGVYHTSIRVIAGPGNYGRLTMDNRIEGQITFQGYFFDLAISGKTGFPEITVNGETLDIEQNGHFMPEVTVDESDTIDNGAGVLLRHYTVVIRFSAPLTLPDAPVYHFHFVENGNPLIDWENSALGMGYAQEGAKVELSPLLNVKGHTNRVTGILANGVEYPDQYGTYIIMPAEDVYIDGVVNGGMDMADQTVVKDLTIHLDFDEDVYYGRRLPTTEEFKKALRFSTSVSGAGLHLDMIDVDYLFDDSLSEKMEPWVGNTFLSFVIKAKDGYVFTDSTLTELDEHVAWMNENVKVTVNGKRMYYGNNNGDMYYDGYFVDTFYTAGINGVEFHVFWYGGLEVDFDTSGYKTGDKVTIPDGLFEYDGYVSYCYDYIYEDVDGFEQRERVTGNTFTYPKTNGKPLRLVVLYVRGEGSRATQKITKDAADTIDVNTDNAKFPSGTIVSADLVKGDKPGEKQTVDHVKNAVKDIGTECMVLEIGAQSFNQTVQPDGRVLIEFPVPQGYSRDYIDFYYVAPDGTVELIPLQYNDQTKTFVAVLEHFSLYTIVKTNEKTVHDGHIVHDLTKVDAVSPSCDQPGSIAYYTCTCGKWFADAAGVTEITDRESVRLQPVHTDDDGDRTCDLCGQGGVEPTQPPTQPSTTVPGTEPNAPDVDPGGEGNAAPQPLPENDGSWVWIAIAAAVAVVAIAVAAVLLLKQKNKK